MRIWKARASDKLAVVNTREKAAMEYRDALRERWKFDEEVSKVSRYVFCSISISILSGTFTFRAGVDVYQNLFTKRHISSTLCWMRVASRRNGGENTRGQARPNQWRRGRRLSSWNKASRFRRGSLSLFSFFFAYCIATFSLLSVACIPKIFKFISCSHHHQFAFHRHLRPTRSTELMPSGLARSGTSIKTLTCSSKCGGYSRKGNCCE